MYMIKSLPYIPIELMLSAKMPLQDQIHLRQFRDFINKDKEFFDERPGPAALFDYDLCPPPPKDLLI